MLNSFNESGPLLKWEVGYLKGLSVMSCCPRIDVSPDASYLVNFKHFNHSSLFCQFFVGCGLTLIHCIPHLGSIKQSNEAIAKKLSIFI